MPTRPLVIPAQAGIQRHPSHAFRIPARAGTTEKSLGEPLLAVKERLIPAAATRHPLVDASTSSNLLYIRLGSQVAMSGKNHNTTSATTIKKK